MPAELAGRCIAFNGTVPAGLHSLDDGRLVYPQGSHVAVGTSDGERLLLRAGHKSTVSCVAISKCGKLLASGDEEGGIVLWDLNTFALFKRLTLHKGRVQSVDFSSNSSRLGSVGNIDDHNLVVWDVASGTALCGASTAGDMTDVVRFFRATQDALLTGCACGPIVWRIAEGKLAAAPVFLRQLRRRVICLAVDMDDRFAYCGTASGDVLQVDLVGGKLVGVGPPKSVLTLGVTAIYLAPGGAVLAAAGNGSIYKMSTEPQPGSTADGVSMLPMRLVHGQAAPASEAELVLSAHCGAITCIAFPYNYSELFAAAGFGEICIWRMSNYKRLLHITVPSVGCNCIALTHDGTSLVSGWDDGKVRAFGPESGRLQYTIHDAHKGKVAALALLASGARIVTGGQDGFVRVWAVTAHKQTLLASMKEHRGAVAMVRLRGSDDAECVSASADGTAIVWDMASFDRRAILVGDAGFNDIAYHPNESQLVTAGHDWKLCYFTAVDGEVLRRMDASATAPICCLAISPDGTRLASGDGHGRVCVWDYDAGVCLLEGVLHSGAVACMVWAPNGHNLVSGDIKAAIVIWQPPDAQ